MNLQQLRNFYCGKTVLVTGHTGFKGAWLCHVLLSLGARVIGIALPPKTSRDIFVLTDIQARIEHHEFDIRDGDRVAALMRDTQPDVVFHLAAQPLVRRSYDEPLVTVATNVIGTANVLEAVRRTPSVSAAVIITTDKVYENKEQMQGYREEDPLGGHDPYSGSKAAADIVTQSYMRSFFNPKHYGSTHKTLIGIARAGNVIGGGDWSEDRLVPDIMRAVLYGDGVITVRSPRAVRPWEHVLEPISGYLILGAKLGGGNVECSGAWNFGPEPASWVEVGEVVQRICTFMGRGVIVSPHVQEAAKHEAGLLMLDVAKAHRHLGWRSRWGIEQTLQETVSWYAAVAMRPSSAQQFVECQIATYFNEGARA